MRHSRLLIVFAIGAAAGCAGPKTKAPSTAASIQATMDPWKLTELQPEDPAPALLWNGLLGLRISRAGSGLGPDGKPLGFFMIDEYEKSGEEKILPLPNPVLVSWTVGNTVFDGKGSKTHDFIKSGGTPISLSGKVSNYNQQLDMKTGILVTDWEQDTPEGGLVKYRCETAIHPASRAIGQRWTVSADKPCTFSIKTLDYSGPNDPQEQLGSDQNQTIAITASKTRAVLLQTKLSGVDPGGAATIDGFRVQEGSLKLGAPAVYERVLCFGPHSETPLPEFSEKNLDRLKAITPKPISFDEIEKASQETWAKRWKTDIEIDGPVEDQQAVHSFLFYLRSAIAPRIARSISPFGLSNSIYNGHIFWDSDIWVFPALALIDPEEAKSISDYRVLKEPAAEGNFRAWFKTVSPSTTRPAVGLKYPWESSVSGLETAPGQTRLENHISGSVLWGLTQASALGLEPSKEVDRFSALAANFYYALGTRGPDGHMQIKNVMSPDENHIGNNDLYTNLLADWLVTGRRWGAGAESLPFVLPHDAKGLLTYDEDPMRAYKQAAAVLSIYPLQFPPAESASKMMLDRFESKVIKNGPAMSDSLHALIRARSGDASGGYDDWRKSWQPFTNNPFLLFSEKRTVNQSYFTTGAAGSLQSVIYGFLGFRIDLSSPPGSTWQSLLMDHRVLSIKPNLPPLWRSVRFKNFQVLDHRYTATITSHGVQVKEGE